MKKLFSLTAALLIAMVMFAAAPTVTINTSSNDYEIRVDGRTYTNTNSNTIRITDISNGSHTIKVYKAGTGIFRTKRLVSEQTFNVQDNDVRINVDRDGNINVRQSTTTRRNSDDRSFENNSDRRSRGNGNKYGHNKEWKKNKAKKNKNWKNRDDDDDDDDDDYKEKKKDSRDKDNKDDSDDRWKRTDRRSTRS